MRKTRKLFLFLSAIMITSCVGTTTIIQDGNINKPISTIVPGIIESTIPPSTPNLTSTSTPTSVNYISPAPSNSSISPIPSSFYTYRNIIGKGSIMPKWSNNGHKIAFYDYISDYTSFLEAGTTTGNSLENISIINSDGTDYKKVSNSGNGYFKFSDINFIDDNNIIFLSDKKTGGYSNLYKYDIKLDKQNQLVQPIEILDFQLDSKAIYYTKSYNVNKIGVFSVNTDLNELKYLFEYFGTYRRIIYNNKTKEIIYILQDKNFNITNISIKSYSILLNSHKDLITTNKYNNVESIKVSNDGNKIAFVLTDVYLQSDLYILDSEKDRNPVKIHSSKNIKDIEWSKNDDFILFSKTENEDNIDTSNIYKMQLNNYEISQITFNKKQNEFPIISPDNKKIAFISNKDIDNIGSISIFDIYTINIDGTNTKRLTYGSIKEEKR